MANCLFAEPVHWMDRDSDWCGGLQKHSRSIRGHLMISQGLLPGVFSLSSSAPPLPASFKYVNKIYYSALAHEKRLQMQAMFM